MRDGEFLKPRGRFLFLKERKQKLKKLVGYPLPGEEAHLRFASLEIRSFGSGRGKRRPR